MQSASLLTAIDGPASAAPAHVALIMDGNGRWAAARGRPRVVGHWAGARAVRRVVDAALALGIGTLTLYAFSSDNWRRPAAEVQALMRLLRAHLADETARLAVHGVRLVVVGRRDRLDPSLRDAIDAAERATAHGTRLRLRIAVDYSARDLILATAAAVAADASSAVIAVADPRAAFAARLGAAMHDVGPAPDVDLLIRTGGERRLSDFLLWECAYAELWFTPTPWPDFDGRELARAVAEFAARERRFGALPPTAANTARVAAPTRRTA